MKVSVTKEEIQQKLSNIQNIVEKRNTMPILSHFLLDAGREGALITATDLQIAIKGPLIAQTEGEGKLSIPARKLYEIVREADGDVVIESEDEQWIRVTFGKSRFRLACLSSEEFPAWPGIEGEDRIVFDTAILSEMIEKTLYAAGETDTRYTLNGLLFHINPTDRSITVVGTDGHRLAIMKKSLETGFGKMEGEKKVILPRKAATELKRFIGGTPQVTAVFGRNHILFTIGDFYFLARLIEGEYPNYEKVIPLTSEKVIRIGRENFLRTIRRVSIMSREKSKAIRLDITDGVLSVSSSDPDLGEARDEVEVEYSGEAIALGFNARYLIDCLSVMTSDNVNFALQEPSSPTLLKEEGNEEYRCVLMPIRL
jgi:DNA polymerase III subunit beta